MISGLKIINNGNLSDFLSFFLILLMFKFIRILFRDARRYINVDNLLKTKISITVKIIFLFIISIIVSIFGINPKNGGTPAILKKIVKKIILLILFFLIKVMVWKIKLTWSFSNSFVAINVIVE